MLGKNPYCKSLSAPARDIELFFHRIVYLHERNYNFLPSIFIKAESDAFDQKNNSEELYLLVFHLPNVAPK